MENTQDIIFLHQIYPSTLLINNFKIFQLGVNRDSRKNDKVVATLWNQPMWQLLHTGRNCVNSGGWEETIVAGIQGFIITHKTKAITNILNNKTTFPSVRSNALINFNLYILDVVTANMIANVPLQIKSKFRLLQSPETIFH